MVLVQQFHSTQHSGRNSPPILSSKSQGSLCVNICNTRPVFRAYFMHSAYFISLSQAALCALATMLLWRQQFQHDQWSRACYLCPRVNYLHTTETSHRSLACTINRLAQDVLCLCSFTQPNTNLIHVVSPCSCSCTRNQFSYNGAREIIQDSHPNGGCRSPFTRVYLAVWRGRTNCCLAIMQDEMVWWFPWVMGND